MEPVDHAFGQQLGFAVGVGGLERVIFFDRRAFRIPVQRRGRGEDQLVQFVLDQSFEKRQGASGIVAKILFRRLHGFARLDQPGEVHHGIVGPGGESAGQNETIRNVPDYQVGFGGKRAAAAMTKIVENGYAMSGLEQFSGDDAADVSSAAGNQDVQEAASASSVNQE